MSIPLYQKAFVYVVEARTGLAKIGVSKNPRKRAEAIHSHSPVPVRLVAFWPGHVTDEQKLHREFFEYRSHAEWFRIEGRLAEYMADISGLGIERIQDWAEITYEGFDERKRLYRERIARSLAKHWADPARRIEHGEKLRHCYRLRIGGVDTTQAVTLPAPAQPASAVS